MKEKTLDTNVFKSFFPYGHHNSRLCGIGKDESFNSFPHNKISDLSKFKTFADDKSKVAKMMKPAIIIVENIVGKGGNAGYQHFLLFLQCF